MTAWLPNSKHNWDIKLMCLNFAEHPVYVGTEHISVKERRDVHITSRQIVLYGFPVTSQYHVGSELEPID